MAVAHPLDIQTRVHHLNHGENLETILFQVKKGCIVTFMLGPTLFGQKVKLYINYPENIESGFKRLQYRKLKWKCDSINKGDDTALSHDISFEMAGSFHYFFTSDGSDNNPVGSGFILVDPALTYGPTNEDLPLDSIQCVTYLAKCLGPFKEWEARLRTAKEAGYNMIHLTPIQELGESLSSYSLRDQLKLNHMFDSPTRKCTLDDVSTLVEKMKNEWKVLAITDVVLNHTANESEWILDHPESTFNLRNSPHLRPAYLLDRALWYFSLEIGKGKWTGSGLPPAINTNNHVETIRQTLQGYYKHQLNLHEFFMVDIDKLVNQFRKHFTDPSAQGSTDHQDLQIIQDPEYRRLGSTVDMSLALLMYGPSSPLHKEGVDKCCHEFQKKLKILNDAKKAEIDMHFNAAVENVLSCVRYECLDPNGPRNPVVSAKYPIVPPYFKNHSKDSTIEEEEKQMYGPKGRLVFAHNGWVMGGNALKNFAEPGSHTYLRRELVAWGDSVKLRYGDRPEDSPYLWKHMTEYVQQLSRVFYGLRLDNCHSTPIHVAEYLMDKAREVRPDLFIVAELFTSSEAVDNVFVNRLGITSLIREAMQAPDSHEQGRLVYRYGGSSVGAFAHPISRPLSKCIAHAVFMDITHDNECPIQTRSVYDSFPTAAMVSMACCATGSSWGYDQLVPHQVHVVNENRFYTSWTDNKSPKRGFINVNSGIIAGKRAMNDLHAELGASGYTQVFVDQRDENTVAITRHCPATHQSVILVARTAFRVPDKPKETYYMKPLHIEGHIDSIVLEGSIVPVDKASTPDLDEQFINGLADFRLKLRENIQPYESEMIEVNSSSENGCHEIDFINFPPGSVIAIRVSLDSEARAAILKIRSCVSQFGYRMRSYSGSVLTHATHGTPRDFLPIVAILNLADLNRVLFRSDNEEKNEVRGGGVYGLPGYGSLTYCGLQGVISELLNIHTVDDLGHPLCNNLRAGYWLPDYISTRLSDHPATQPLGRWFLNVFESLRKIPRYLVPCYFDTIVTGAYSSLLRSLWNKMSEFVAEGSLFVKHLALGSVILCGVVESAPLPHLSPALADPVPSSTTDRNGKVFQECVTMSAGIPHFATGYMRNWGRDTFISLRGLLLVTGRHEDARYIILAFGGCLRHGLIPNLLDKGVCARFNCRDAVWWWLQAIQEYTKFVQDGHLILKDNVSRIFPTDDSPPLKPGECDQPLYDVIQEALQRHFQGVKFRERNAGPRLDEHMRDQGFNNEIGVDKKTGFVYGGNGFNCGTWMDKMGSSDKARNRGIPATPRDGSAVEIVGLCKSTLRWLDQMFQDGHYPYCTVEEWTSGDKFGTGRTTIMSFKQWGDLIQSSFEPNFWISTEVHASDNALINRRGIYKDTFQSSSPWTDYQLRPNFLITMCVAPELFVPQHAGVAIDTAETHLLGPLGMKTLDPSDWLYNGDYNNDDNSDNKNTAGGYNYHQGPEWVFLIGYFLRAKLSFYKTVQGNQGLHEVMDSIKRDMAQHFEEIQKSKWKGLPELTNSGGKVCPFSCAIQAWSHATLLEVLYDMDIKCRLEDE